GDQSDIVENSKVEISAAKGNTGDIDARFDKSFLIDTCRGDVNANLNTTRTKQRGKESAATDVTLTEATTKNNLVIRGSNGNDVGENAMIDKGPPNPSRDVPASQALASIFNAVNPIVAAYKLARTTALVSDFDRGGELVKSKEKAGDASVSKGVNIAALAKSSTAEMRAAQVVNLKATTDGDATGVIFLDGKIAADGEAMATNCTQLQEPLTGQPSSGAQNDCFMTINTGQSFATVSNVKEVLHEDVKGDNRGEDNEEGWRSITRKSNNQQPNTAMISISQASTNELSASKDQQGVTSAIVVKSKAWADRVDEQEDINDPDFVHSRQQQIAAVDATGSSSTMATKALISDQDRALLDILGSPKPQRCAYSTGSKTTSQKIKAKRHEPSSAKRVKRQEPL
ncbi:hypothetical protein A4A49_11814, partial [Nicotiana attenuata]